MNLSFVYPVYNEIENLPRLLPETERIAAGIASDIEVVLVDDGSSDGSREFMDELARRHSHVRSIHHAQNRGLGAAIRTGLLSATKDLVLYMDSDFPVSADQARAALISFKDQDDVLIGYRLGRAEGPRREIMSWTYNRLIRWGFGLTVRDVNFAFKLMRRSVLEQMGLRSEGSFIDAELLLEAKRLGARIREIGLLYHTRTAGQSTAASYWVVLRILSEMWRYSRQLRAGRTGPSRLIVNADDFGLCEAVNLGVARAFDEGIVTSASILVTGRAFEQARRLATERPGLDLGVHLSLTQTQPALAPAEVPSLVDGDGRFPADWKGFLNRYVCGRVRMEEVTREFRAQIDRARAAGLRLSHLDSHQHIHMLPRVAPVVSRLASEYGLPAVRYPHQRGVVANRRSVVSGLRRLTELSALRLMCRIARGRVRKNGLILADDFRGFAEAGKWDSDMLAETIRNLEPGLTEIGCHPGADDAIDEELRWHYAWEQELSALTDPAVAAAVRESGVRLTTYHEVADGAVGR
ncbi:MAG: ChbG/HpnK family deacetylase [Armatimonadetes bacterium]|nr:ChbG/HpnK family deacetylase [Armatimonadota bacterium]